MVHLMLQETLIELGSVERAWNRPVIATFLHLLNPVCNEVRHLESILSDNPEVCSFVLQSCRKPQR